MTGKGSKSNRLGRASYLRVVGSPEVPESDLGSTTRSGWPAHTKTGRPRHRPDYLRLVQDTDMAGADQDGHEDLARAAAVRSASAILRVVRPLPELQAEICPHKREIADAPDIGAIVCTLCIDPLRTSDNLGLAVRRDDRYGVGLPPLPIK